jgi:hypothetical protein
MEIKKLLALIGCLMSLSAFAGDLTGEFRKVADVLIAKPFNLQNFERAIRATTHLKDDIDYAPENSRKLIHVAVNEDMVDAVKLLVEKFHSDIRQDTKGPGSAPITSVCLYMGSTNTYKYLYSLHTKSENDARAEWDEKALRKGEIDDAVNHAWLIQLQAKTKDHEMKMKKIRSISLKDVLNVLLPVFGASSGAF